VKVEATVKIEHLLARVVLGVREEAALAHLRPLQEEKGVLEVGGSTTRRLIETVSASSDIEQLLRVCVLGEAAPPHFCHLHNQRK
jgi:hypothetical protein